MSRDGYWISAPPKEGCFIVNVGDQLQAWSNGLYVSTLHRVLNYSGVERYSVPFFFSANFETVIEVCLCNTGQLQRNVEVESLTLVSQPIKELMTDGHVAKHSPLTAGQASATNCD
jgi:isopenicillin N synthase-like dioxygenase